MSYATTCYEPQCNLRPVQGPPLIIRKTDCIVSPQVFYMKYDTNCN
jgi:hypothetical protein